MEYVDQEKYVGVIIVLSARSFRIYLVALTVAK